MDNFYGIGTRSLGSGSGARQRHSFPVKNAPQVCETFQPHQSYPVARPISAERAP